MEQTDLKLEAERLSEEIEALQERYYEIQTKLRDAHIQEELKHFETWDIQTGDCLLCFARQATGYHWSIAKTIKVLDVDKKRRSFNCIMTDYRESDYQYISRTEETTISFSLLPDMEDEFEIWVTDEVQRALLNQYMCDLSLTYDNFVEYRDRFKAVADRIITK